MKKFNVDRLASKVVSAALNEVGRAERTGSGAPPGDFDVNKWEADVDASVDELLAAIKDAEFDAEDIKALARVATFGPDKIDIVEEVMLLDSDTNEEFQFKLQSLVVPERVKKPTLRATQIKNVSI